MSPQETDSVRTTNQWDALLSLAGIGALTFLSYIHPDWGASWVIGTIGCLAMRATGVLVNAAKLAVTSKMANAVAELNK